jgi:hypothetical protein
MIESKKEEITKLWEGNYKEYVKEQLMTKIEAFKMIANELGIYFSSVEKELENKTTETKNDSKNQ